MRLTIKTIFQVLFLLLVQELKIFEAVFIVRLDLFGLNHVSESHFVHIALQLSDLVLVSHLSHRLSLFPLRHRHLVLLLKLLPFDLPPKHLLGLV
jgi:hypothetical protein